MCSGTGRCRVSMVQACFSQGSSKRLCAEQEEGQKGLAGIGSWEVCTNSSKGADEAPICCANGTIRPLESHLSFGVLCDQVVGRL